MLITMKVQQQLVVIISDCSTHDNFCSPSTGIIEWNSVTCIAGLCGAYMLMLFLYGCILNRILGFDPVQVNIQT